MTAAAGLVVSIGGSKYFVPVDRVGFVVRAREVRGGRLVMPRGSLPYVEAAPSSAPRRDAVAIRTAHGFVALGVDAVDLAPEANRSSWGALESILEGAGAAPPP